MRSTKWILAALGSAFLVMFLLISSGLLFPYSGSPDSPRPKRIFLQVKSHKKNSHLEIVLECSRVVLVSRASVSSWTLEF